MRQKQQKVWDRSSTSNVRGIRHLETWPSQWFHSRNMLSAISTDVIPAAMAWWSQKECDQQGERIFDQYLEMIFASAALLRHQGSGWSSAVSWDHTHCQTHLLKPSSSTRKPQNSFQQMPQPRLFHIFPFFLELFARMLPLRTSMCFTWLPAEGTQGPWRSKMKS